MTNEIHKNYSQSWKWWQCDVSAHPTGGELEVEQKDPEGPQRVRFSIRWGLKSGPYWGRGGSAGCARTHALSPPPHPHPTPQEPKRSFWWDYKRFKMIQNNVVVVGLTILMHFKQWPAIWRTQISIFFFRGSMLPQPPKTPPEYPIVPI